MTMRVEPEYAVVKCIYEDLSWDFMQDRDALGPARVKPIYELFHGLETADHDICMAGKESSHDRTA
jgi:hypothetical protein